MVSKNKIYGSVAVLLAGSFALLLLFAGGGPKQETVPASSGPQITAHAAAEEPAVQLEQEQLEEKEFFKGVESYDPTRALGQDTVDIGPPPCDFADWTGKKADQSALMALNRPFRILPPGAMYTQDFMPERINVHTDDNGNIIKVTCG